MSTFTCRRATAVDVSALRTLIEQQRLAGVRYSDTQHSASDSNQPSSASASSSSCSSSSSLFAARSASNAAHLRSVWGLTDIGPLLSSQWLTAVVSDGDGVVCIACFHYQPNQHSLDGAARRDSDSNASSSSSNSSRRAHEWPLWLAQSLQCVSPSSLLASSFHPSSCRFLTYFACCSVANSRSERRLVECLLRFVFECDSGVSQLLALRPHTETLSPVDGTPLSLLFKPLEEPSAATSHRPSGPADGPTGDLLSCWRVPRSALWPTLTVRRGRLEDHDDLLPLFGTSSQQQQQQQLGAVQLTRVWESQSAPLSPLSSSRSVSPLSLLSSTSSVSLVAECAGRAVGLLCLTADVDIARLRADFQLEHVAQLRRARGLPSSPLSAQREVDEALSDDWSDVARLPSAVIRHLRLCYGALLAAGGTCILPPTSRSPSASLDAGQQQQQQQQQQAPAQQRAHTSHTVGIEWQSVLLLLAATSTEASQRLAEQQLSAYTATEVAAVIHGWAGTAADSADGGSGGSGMAHLATESDFVRLCCESVALLHSNRPDAALLPSAVGLWLDCLDRKMPAAAVHQLHAVQQQQQQTREDEEAAIDGADDGSAFAVSCFVLSDEHWQQAERFILAAFAALPERDWMLLSAPHAGPHMPLMTHMTQLRPLPHTQHRALDAVYALHRQTAISALSPLEASIAVRRAEQSDFPFLTPLLNAQAAAEYELAALLAVPAGASSHHSARLAASASTSSAVRLEVQRAKRCVAAGGPCIIVTCAGECIGMIRAQPLQSAQQLHALQAHYDSSLSSAAADSEQQPAEREKADGMYGRHLLIRSFVLHPLFTCHTRLVLQETMRLCQAQALHYTITADQRDQHSPDSGGRGMKGGIQAAGSYSEALLSCMQQRAPLIVPAAALSQHDKYDALHMPAAVTNNSSSHSPAGLPIVDEAAGTDRLSRLGHEDDTALAPGPPLSLAHLHINHSSAGSSSSEQQHSHRHPAPAPTAVSCSVCGTIACPTFALHTVTPPFLSAGRRLVSQRIVFIGASATSLSALIALLTRPSSVYFTSLTLISLQPLTALLGRGSLPQPSAAVSAVPSSDFHLDSDMLQRLCLEARVQVLTGRVVDVDSGRQLVTLEQSAAAAAAAACPAVSRTLLVPYDELIVASGMQPASEHISQQLSVGQPTVAATGHSRADGSSGSLRPPAEATTPSYASLSPQQQQQTLPLPAQPLHAATVASTLPLSPLQPTELSGVSGVWPLSSVEHAVAFLTASTGQLLLPASHSSPPSIVVSGASLSALTVLSTLLSMGVAGDCISWVHPCSNLSHLSVPPSSSAAAAGTESCSSLSVAVLGDELPVLATVLATLADERIRIVQRATVTAMHVRLSHSGTIGNSNASHSADNDSTADSSSITHSPLRYSGTASAATPFTASLASSVSRSLQSVVLSSGDVLPCSVLLLCDDAAVDSRLLDVAVRRLGLVHDGRFVVDEHFRSASLSNVRLAGPMAKFQRGLLQTATESAVAASSSSATRLGVRLLDHSFYSSISIGRALAAEIESAAQQQPTQQQPPLSAIDPLQQLQSANTLFPSLHAVSCVRRAVLPGPVGYFHSWSPAYSMHPSAACERVLSQSFPSYSFSLHICTDTLRIVRLRYWGSFELLAAHNLTRLIGLPVTYCNRLLWRWESNQIRSLLLFLQQDWAQLLCSPAFATFRSRLIEQLGELYSGQLSPILDKLTAFQRSLLSDQKRRHEQQQLQHQRRSSNIKSSLMQPTQFPSVGSDSVDVSALQALDGYLPAQFRDVTHRAVLSFIISQQHSLPPSLHQSLALQSVV